MDPLDAMDQRILGSLLEKQRTVPATYPLTLNALRTACNQSNSRDPVTAYEERDLEQRCRELRQRGWVRVVAAGRSLKYHQLVEEQLALQPDERALLTVLLLRGPQAPGELRTRTERLHAFGDRSHVEETLARMADPERGLVMELPRRPGQQDARWVHLLGPVAEVEAAIDAAAPAVDRDTVLADGAAARDARVLACYEAVAAAYAKSLGDELDGKPFDRWLLTRLAEGASGPVLDVGTGPGQVAGFLAAAGAEATGRDLSPAMIAQAQRLFPDVGFEVGDFAGVLRPPAAAGWSVITAWYAFVHLAGSELPDAVAALVRVLADDGVLAVAVHAGAEVLHTDEFLGVEVDVDFVLHYRAEVVAAMAAAGLREIEWYERAPLPGEVETVRAYVLGRK